MNMGIMRTITFISVGLLLSDFALAQEQTKDAPKQMVNTPTQDVRLAIMDMKIASPDLDPLVGETLAAVLSAEVKAQVGTSFTVISRNDLRALVGQQIEAQELGCDEPRCIADLGKAAAAHQMLTSSLGKVGDDWVLTLELIDVAQSLVTERQAITWRGEAQGLVELVRPMVTFLLDPEATNYKGHLEIISAQEGALVHLDEEEQGNIPLPLLKDLAIGRHRVKVFKPGYLPFEGDVVVQHQETTLFQVQLIDEASLKPWYTSWWVWGGTATLVAGALTTAYFLQPETSTSIRVHSPLP
jgi:hypothetical protein